MRIIPLGLVASCTFVLTARAEPGEKWLECYVGRGGLESPEAVAQAALAALDDGDSERLRALAPDRCASFRAGEVTGLEHIVAAATLMNDTTLEPWVRALDARLELEEISAKAPPRFVEEPQAAGDYPGEVGYASETLRGPVLLDLIQLDGRWYLLARPRVDGPGERVTGRYATLTRELTAAIGKRKGTAAERAIAAWWKKKGGELERAALAAKTIPDGDRDTFGALRQEFFAAHTALSESKGLPAGWATAFGPSAGKTGIVACDNYLEKMLTCSQSMPEEARQAMTDAFNQVRAAWTDAAQTDAGKQALEVGCQAAYDAAKDGMDATCPGVF